MPSRSTAVVALLAWIAESGTTKLRFCADVDVHPTTLHGWERGKFLPSLRVAIAIEDYTDGVVAPRLWLTEAPGE